MTTALYTAFTARGGDTTAFLHGQFTGDLAALAPGAGCLTAWCSPKGRVLTTLLAVRRENDWVLVLPADHAATVTRRLGLFVLRADVRLDAAPAPELAALQAAGHLAPLPAPGQDWQAGQVRRCVPWVGAATSEQFLPQELDLEAWGGLSYAKGCYPGQEVVARLHYRGAVKRGPCPLWAPGGTLAAPGTRVEDTVGAAVGTVLYPGAGTPDGVPVLAVLDHAVPGSADLFLATGRVPLVRDLGHA